MKCPKCGLENRSNALFCKQCGQSLQMQQPTPPTHPPPLPTICPACGATTKPAAQFCPRCGKPLLPELTQPVSAVTDTIPTPSSITQPYTGPPPPVPPTQSPTYAHLPVQPPPPSAAPSAERSFPGWAGWALAIAVFACIAVLVVAAIVFGPQLLGGKAPTVTPMPEAASAFDAQVAITVSAVELHPGDPLTVTVTINNTGQVAFGNLRYQLLGEWEPFFAAPTGPSADREIDVPPAGSDTAIFLLEATQTGTAQIHANVIVDTREDPPATKPVSSEYVVSVSIVP